MSDAVPLSVGEPSRRRAPTLQGPPGSGPGLQDMLAEAHSGILLFGLTPPRRSETEQRVKEIAESRWTASPGSTSTA